MGISSILFFRENKIHFCHLHSRHTRTYNSDKIHFNFFFQFAAHMKQENNRCEMCIDEANRVKSIKMAYKRKSINHNAN